MIHEEYPIQAEGSGAPAKLTTYLISYYEDLGVTERPLVI